VWANTSDQEDTMYETRRMTPSALALLALTALLAWGGLLLPTAQARKVSSAQEANKATARRYYEEVLNQGNMAAVEELVAPNHVLHGLGVPPLPAGTSALDRLRQAVNRLRAIFPDLHYTVEDQIAEGDKVVTRWTRRGTQQGEWTNTPFGTIAPTGKEVTTTGVAIQRFVNGKIAETWVDQDSLGLFQQLGVIPQPQPAAARP
jgi:predicted ester cyclase